MKVPARRRGNEISQLVNSRFTPRLNESPRPKAGKFLTGGLSLFQLLRLNESPRPKAGKYAANVAPMT